MQYIAPLGKKEYLYELRQQMGSFTDFLSERFTGIILGNFIYITHHAGFEWNRKITNEKSRAIGFVTKHGDGCKVRVIFTRGYLELLWMIFYYLLGIPLMLLVSNGDWLPNIHIWALAFSVTVGIISYIQCWFTERGQYGMCELRGLLQDPSRFWTEYGEE